LGLARYVRAFIRHRGDDLLERLDEHPFEGADWTIASHGAVIRVIGEHDDLFERLLVVLPRPADASPEKFRSWAETRLAHLGWYMETCNTGKQISTVSHDASVVSVLMLRLGRDPNDASTELPAPAQLPDLLHDFTLNLERYVHALGDSELRYVRALRLYRVPRHQRRDEFVLGVDVLPTVIGLAEPTVPIAPLMLVRGVIGELTELLDQRREQAVAASSLLRFAEWRRTRRTTAEMQRVVDGLDRICALIDTERVHLSVVRDRLAGLRPPARDWRRPVLKMLAMTAAALGLIWLWLG